MSDWAISSVHGVLYEMVSFSPDNRFFAATSQKEVVFFETETGKKIAIAEHSDPVTRAMFTVRNGTVLFVSLTSAPEAIEWGFNMAEGKVFEVKRVRLPILDAVFPLAFETGTGTRFCYIRKRTVFQGQLISDFELVMLNEDWSIASEQVWPFLGGGAELKRRMIAVTEHYFVVAHGRDIRLYNFDKSYRTVNHWEQINPLSEKSDRFCSIACRNGVLAAARISGKVTIWRPTGPDFKLVNPSFVHWHHSQPFIALSRFGGLFSSGGEGVFVKYAPARSTPAFLPRLSTPARRIFVSPDDSYTALLHVDNAITIVMNASMKVRTVAEGIMKTYRFTSEAAKDKEERKELIAEDGEMNNPKTNKATQAFWYVDPAFPSLAITNSPGRPGWTQWVNVATGLTMNVAHLSLENYESRREIEDMVPSYYDLVAVAVGKHEWASLETRMNWPSVSNRLRFWSRNFESGDPSALRLLDTFQPSEDTVLVKGCPTPVSDDDKIFITVTTDSKLTVYIPCMDGAHYKRDDTRHGSWQGAKFRCASNIQAGGLFVTAHEGASGDTVVLWYTASMSVLEVVATDSTVLQVSWADPTTFVVRTQKSVSAYDVTSLSMVWQVEQPLHLHTGPFGGLFAVNGNQALEVDVSTGRVIDQIAFPAEIATLCAAQEPNGDPIFLAMAMNGAIYTARPSSTTVEENAIEKKHETPFAKLTSSGQIKDPDASYRARRVHAIRPAKVLEAPAHALPPLTHLAPLFISSCLAPAVAQKAN